MQQVTQALHDVQELYEKFLGAPPPKVEPGAYVSFPPGVDPVAHAIEEVDRLKSLSEQIAKAPAPATWVPRANNFLTQDAFIIHLEIPGVVRDSLKVFVTGGEIAVRGERKPPEKLAELQPLAIETAWGSFERRFVLPAGSVTDAIEARYLEGILEVKVAVEAASPPTETKIEIA